MMMKMEKMKKPRIDDKSKIASAMIAAFLSKPAIVTTSLEPDEDVALVELPLELVSADPFVPKGMNKV